MIELAARWRCRRFHRKVTASRWASVQVRRMSQDMTGRVVMLEATNAVVES
jgi:hypothetical protein